MKIIKLPIEGNIEIIEVRDVFDYMSSIFGSTHLDIKARNLKNYAIIYNDGALNENINKRASKLYNGSFNSIEGDCYLLKTSDNYIYHDCYEEAISITEEDVKEVEAALEKEYI